jgi:hypothetical protein
MKHPARLLLLGLTLFGAACGSGSNDTVTSPTITSAATEVFGGTLKASGSAFYSFSVFQTGTVGITLASLTSAATGAALSTTTTLLVGIPSGTGCGVLKALPATPSLSAQITAELAAGIYCVSITDTGGLTADASFAIRITQGTLNLKSTTSPEVFASNLAVNGSSTRTFTVATSGSMTANLDDVGSSKVVGVGIGIWRFDTPSCNLTQVVNSSGGARFAMNVDQGTYCVKVFDVGNLTTAVSFAVTIVHP